MVGPYEREVKKFVKVAHWLKETDMLMLLHVKTLARTLDSQLEEDGTIQAATAGQFRLSLSELKEPKASQSDKDDDDEEGPALHFS